MNYHTYELLEELHRLGICARALEPMSEHTSFRTGGAAAAYVLPADSEQLARTVNAAAAAGAPYFILGRGSNVLVGGNGYDGAVIAVPAGRATADDDGVTADAGATLARASAAAAAHGLAGLEFAAGIPGTVGGGLCMNAGAYGGEMSRVVEWSEYFIPGENIVRLPRERHAFGYRASFYRTEPRAVALTVRFALERGDRRAIEAKMLALAAQRRASQPLEYPSAGSAFKRPPGDFAGRLIERCGLKGFSIGGAQVSEKHAGFIINRAGASPRDIYDLTLRIQDVVLRETGVSLEREIIFLGEF